MERFNRSFTKGLVFIMYSLPPFQGQMYVKGHTSILLLRVNKSPFFLFLCRSPACNIVACLLLSFPNHNHLHLHKDWSNSQGSKHIVSPSLVEQGSSPGVTIPHRHHSWNNNKRNEIHQEEGVYINILKRFSSLSNLRS